MKAGGEERFVAWLRRRLPGSGIGDDTAAFAARGPLVVTVDQQIEGTHFAPGTDLRQIGRRLVRVNLSDLAASGAKPRWALLALGLPPESDPRHLVDGVIAETRRFGAALVGGDVAHAPTLAASLTLIGEKGTADAGLSRDRARPGHSLWLGGTVGESALGCELLLRGAEVRGRSIELRKGKDFQLGKKLRGPASSAVIRNLLPTPQLELGQWLASLGRRAGACIDVSDGLAKDLRRICTASGVGCELDLRLVHAATAPRHDELALALGLDPVAVALAGGEDYVLLFTLPAAIAPPARFGCARVGRIVRGRSLAMLDADGRRLPLPLFGWDHLGQ